MILITVMDGIHGIMGPGLLQSDILNINIVILCWNLDTKLLTGSIIDLEICVDVVLRNALS
jgi:hypothetical protein